MHREAKRTAVRLMFILPASGMALTRIAVFAREQRQPLVISNYASMFTGWLLFTLAIPVMVCLVEKFPLERPRPRALLVHAGGLLTFAALQVAVPSMAANLSVGLRPMAGVVARAHNGIAEGLTYLVVAGIVLVLRQRRLARRSALAKARLEARLERVKLDELRVGFEPDRVVAAVAEIEANVETSPARAEEDLHRLSHFLRGKLARISAGSGTGRSIAPPTPPLPEWMLMLAVFLTYAGYGAFASLARVTNMTAHGITPRMPAAFGELIVMSIAGALSLPLIAAYRRFGPSRILLLGALCLAHAGAAEAIVMMRPLGIRRPQAETFLTSFALSCIVLFLLRRVDLEHTRARSRIASAELSRLVSEATLRSLRTQLAPHFLFNTLNSVLHLVRSDAAAARLMLQRLRKLLRMTVQDTRQEVSLREDLEVTENYIEIERVRFRDALDVSLTVDPRSLDARVPSFLLQPLVENAVRHGALQTLGRCRITVRAQCEADRLQIAIENDGCLVSPESWREGIGLSSVRLRLRHLYGDDQDVSAQIVEHGVRVNLRLPLRT